jgi:hypothetical protein
MTRPVKNASVALGVLPKPQPDVEIGVSAHLPFVTPYKGMWEALRTDEITVKQLVAMRKTDGQARALYRLITLPIRSALRTATFVPESQIEGGEEEAAFCEQMFTLPANAGGMAVPFNRVIAQMLMAIFDGFSAFEMVLWTPPSGPLKGKWTIKKLAGRPAETLTFLFDNKGEFAGLRQRTMFQGREIDVTIPADQVIYFAANEEERPYYGQSYFESAYYHWDKKFKLYVISHLAAQRAAVGTRVGKLPPNPSREDKIAFQRALADLGVAQSMTIPENYTVESLKEGPNFDFLAYINHHNSQMSKSVLAAFFDDQQGSGGDTTLVDFGRQSDALFLLMLQTIMSEIEEVINQKIIPRFIDYNFGSGKYPRFQFGSLSEEQKHSMLELFKQLAVAGLSLTIRPELVHEMEKQVAEMFGLEIDWETVEEEMAVAKEAAQMQADAAMGGMGGEPGAEPAEGGGGQAPQVDPALLPNGFTLLTHEPDEAHLALTDLARDLLDEAYDTVELGRGQGRGPRRVRTSGGARYYGEPVGSTIMPNQEQRTAHRGVEGKAYGGGIRNPHGTRRQVHGGGPGAAAQNPGKVVTEPAEGRKADPKRFYGHPNAPGVALIDYGDGTVAIRDVEGNISPRQRFDISKFVSLGWQVAGMEKGKPEKDKPKKAATKRATKA